MNDAAERRILVIGQTGQLAQSLAERARAGQSVQCFGRDSIDLSDPETAARALRHIVAETRPAAIINAAAYTAVDMAEKEADVAHAVNAAAPGLFAAVAGVAAIPFLHVSTDYVFPGTSDTPYQPDDTTGPLGVYGASKLAGEQAIAASGADYAIIRTAWVFSPFGRNFVKTMLALAETRDELRVVDDQIGNPTGALDLADALLAMAATWPEDGVRNTYHFAGKGAVSWCGFASAIFGEAQKRGLPHATALPITTADYPTPARRPARSMLDCASLQGDFGIAPRDWQAMLADTLDRIAPANPKKTGPR